MTNLKQETPQFPSSVIDYLFTSTFDANNGITITHCCSNSSDPVDRQLGNILDSAIPQNIHKFRNIEHNTTIPLFIVEESGTLIKSIDTNSKVKIPSITSCYLYTISYLKFSKNEQRNAKINAISVITTLPIFQVFKPLLCFLLHETFNQSFDFNIIDTVFKNLNKSRLNHLLYHFQNLNSASRFVLTRIQPDFSLNESLRLPENLLKYFTDAGKLYKTSVKLDESGLEFPIQIPKSSIVTSSLSMFGIDLQRNSNIKNMIKTLNSIYISSHENYKESCLAPYPNIKPLHVLLNAMVLNKKIVLYAHNTCYNNLTSFIETLYLIFNSSNTSNLNIPFYPIIDLPNIDLIQSKECYLIGTSNPMLMKNLDWNIFLNFDTETMHLQINNDEIDEKYFHIVDHNIPSNASINTNTSNSIKNNTNNHTNNLIFNNFSLADDTYKPSPTKSEFTITSFSMTPSPSTISSIDSFQADTRLPRWNPSCFPRIITDTEKANYSLNEINGRNNNSNSNACNDTINSSHNNSSKFIWSKFPILPGSATVPRIDRALDEQLERLVRNHHDDETLFVLLTNYIRNLTTRVLPAFYHFLTMLQIRDFRSHILLNNQFNGVSDLDIDGMVRDFIQENKIIQPFPLNYPFDPHHSFLDDPKIIAHYARIVLSNVQLLRLSVHYNSSAFKNPNLIPGFLFSWSGGEENTNDHNVDIRLDTHYLISILDRMIDGTSNDSWQLNKYLLLQIFKSLNAILKVHGTGANGLSSVLMDTFIEKRGDESFARSCGIDLSVGSNKPVKSNLAPSILSSSSNSSNYQHRTDTSFLSKLRRLGVSPENVEFVRDVIHGGNGTESEYTRSRSKRSTKSKESTAASFSKVIQDNQKSKTGLSTQHCEDDELLAHVGTLGTQRFTKLILVSALYLSIRGPEDIVETKKGIRRKDLLLAEFKRFLSSVLNDPFFKEFVLVEMDDFIKLTVNDFIDYHM